MALYIKIVCAIKWNFHLKTQNNENESGFYVQEGCELLLFYGSFQIIIISSNSNIKLSHFCWVFFCLDGNSCFFFLYRQFLYIIVRIIQGFIILFIFFWHKFMLQHFIGCVKNLGQIIFGCVV